ncbi:hypothetical protein V6U90_05750 [Micromonospora sp. CPCC 206060]|uniref:hypothetical protein n=1 Tax=Micromonospora sp. CPCC 206060 TaxID=3122406 RepID=UPI002FF300BB
MELLTVAGPALAARLVSKGEAVFLLRRAVGLIAISRYGICMAVKKVTVTLPEELVAALGAAAREDGVPLSRLVASAAESELRRRVGRRLVADWQAEHGAFTLEEIAAARAEMAAADAQALSGPGQVAA